MKYEIAGCVLLSVILGPYTSVLLMVLLSKFPIGSPWLCFESAAQNKVELVEAHPSKEGRRTGVEAIHGLSVRLNGRLRTHPKLKTDAPQN